jgi:glycine cleavage system H lipoate-binding protein
MMPHDILTLYSTKALEYLIAVTFLALFVPFWRYAMGTAGALVEAVAREPLSRRIASWFRVPADTYFHPGHTWARADAGGVLTVGLDDFAQKLVGPLRSVQLPPEGSRLIQGESAWSVRADSKAVDMIAPVGGVVVAVNQHAMDQPAIVNDDPYGNGWLLKVRSPHRVPQLATLRAGDAARRWMEEVADSLMATLTPSLGLVYQDGGMPVDGLARAIAGEDWDRFARRFLLTEDGDQPAPRDAGRLAASCQPPAADIGARDSGRGTAESGSEARGQESVVARASSPISSCGRTTAHGH